MSFKYKIEKIFTFAYAHALDLHYDSSCNNIHGHNAKVIVILKSNKLNRNNMILDFNDLKIYMNKILKPMDHSFILSLKNTDIEFIKQKRQKIYLFPFYQTTAENFAKHICDKLEHQILKNHNNINIEIKFYETVNNAASYRNDC